MPTTTIKTATREVRISQDSFSAPGNTDAIRVAGGIVVQISGSATAISVVVERSTVDPNTNTPGTPNWVRIEDAPLSGNPSTGMTAAQYVEPAIAWWRVRVVSITGTAFVSISGKVD